MNEDKKATCICRKQGCWRGSEEGIPGYCQANHYDKEIEDTRKAYTSPMVADLYKAACKVGAVNDGYRPRIEEALDFAQQMGLCMGHDILFTQHAEAPVSTLIVKDRLMGITPQPPFTRITPVAPCSS